MNAKTKLEAVPTNAQLLREAIARRDSTARDIETTRARAKCFAPIEAEVSAAQGELSAVLQRDAAAMQKWVDDGAQGLPPEPDHKTRDAAARKLAEASAKLSATGSARQQIEADTRDAHQRHLDALKAVRLAEFDVLAPELLRSAQAMKDAALVYLAAEQHYFASRTALFDLDSEMAQAPSDQAAAVGAPMNVQQEREFAQQAHAKSQKRLAALRAGQEVSE
jgi:hypothetical protein